MKYDKIPTVEDLNRELRVLRVTYPKTAKIRQIIKFGRTLAEATPEERREYRAYLDARRKSLPYP
jgi:hypothetical protein